ncbi:hypothetical protein NECID01_0315 [Nematocida sp. AWRm77]|nr:hypothetical protein NECID01_0315 [Nematocida sp. AWRm77]
MAHACTYANCTKEFLKRSLLYLHMNTHTGQRPFVCGECPKAYFKSTHLQEHRKRVHGTEKKPECPVCCKQLSSQASLERHRSVCQQKHMCPVCAKEFFRAAWYVKHVRAHTQAPTRTSAQAHTSAPAHTSAQASPHASGAAQTQGEIKHPRNAKHFCGYCGKHFKLAKNKKAHEKGAHQEKTHKCTECSKMFSYAHTLRRHAKVCPA